MLKHVYAECNDCATYPFEGPPNARSNTCIGFNNCLNFLTNLTPWEKKNNKEVNGFIDTFTNKGSLQDGGELGTEGVDGVYDILSENFSKSGKKMMFEKFYLV